MGAGGVEPPNLCFVGAALFQLSYAPKIFGYPLDRTEDPGTIR